MFTYKKLAVLAVALFLGVPSVSMAGSFVVSLVQGKTPAEAVQIIAEQVDVLFGRVSTLETQQAELADDVSSNQEKVDKELEKLRLENENLRLKLDTKADIVVPPTETPECLAIKAELRAIEQQYEIPQALADKYDALREEMREARSKRFEPLKNTGDEMADWQAQLQQAKEAVEEIEERMDEVEKQMEVYEENESKAKAPVIEKGSQSGCLLG